MLLIGKTLISPLYLTNLMPGLIYQLNRKPETLGERGLPKYPVEAAYLTRRGLDGDFNRYRQLR